MTETPGRIAHDHPMFAGHFPGDPIVPGAYLLSWVVAQAQRRLAAAEGAPRVAGVARVKFLRPLRPGEAFSCTWTEGGESLRFSLDGEGGTVASGSLVLRPKTSE